MALTMATIRNPFEPTTSETAGDISHRNDIERYAKAPSKIELAIERLSDAKLRWKPNPKKWSIREIVCHLADSEIVGIARMHQIISASKDAPPTLVAYDQDALAERYTYNSNDEQLALQVFKTLRKHATTLLKSLPREAFEKAGLHPKLGKLTLAGWVKLYADHAETHLQQIQKLKEQLQSYEL
jgi:hypothetical protein